MVHDDKTPEHIATQHELSKARLAVTIKRFRAIMRIAVDYDRKLTASETSYYGRLLSIDMLKGILDTFDDEIEDYRLKNMERFRRLWESDKVELKDESFCKEIRADIRRNIREGIRVIKVLSKA